ncbi:MAG: hypothetical protein CMH53_03930, partial [Myxococcales bacterium]|nr:hypothetical protein [Myxococcales bacterium]
EVFKKAFANEKCGGCHYNYGSMSATYSTLSKQSFCGAPLIVPGNADKSSIVWKLVAGKNLPNGCGKKMPKNSSGISEGAAKMLIEWINAGAKP